MKPYLGKYDDEHKTAHWGYGHKKHGDKRHRSSGTYEGIHYADGEKDEGRTREIVIDSRLAWAAKQDNRLVQNREKIATKKMSTMKRSISSARFHRLICFSVSVVPRKARLWASAAVFLVPLRHADTPKLKPRNSTITRKRS